MNSEEGAQLERALKDIHEEARKSREAKVLRLVAQAKHVAEELHRAAIELAALASAAPTSKTEGADES